MIRARRVKNRIHLTSPYSPRTVAACKRVPGGRWSSKANAWTFPLSVESCLLLREELGPSMRVTRGLSRWFLEEQTKREELYSLQRGTTAVELPRLREAAPALHRAVTEARPYQSHAAQFILTGREVLIADDPGLGKTLEALAGIIESGVPGPYLIVSPKTAATSVWPREITRWVPGVSVLSLPEGRSQREEVLSVAKTTALHIPLSARSLWVSVHPEAISTKSYWQCREVVEDEDTGEIAPCGVRTTYTKKPTSVLGCKHERPKSLKRTDDHTFPQLFDIEWGAIVVDECHDSLVRKSGTPTQRRMGLDLLRLRKDGLRIAISGTPLRNKPHQLWGTLNWLRPKVYSGFWRWASQYWALGGFSGFELGKPIEGREKMIWDEAGAMVLRRTKDEVADDMPPKTYVGTPLDPSDEESPVGIWLDLTPAQERAYKAMHADSAAALKNGTLTADGDLAQMTRLEQLATTYGEVNGKDFMPSLPSNKYNWIEAFLAEMGYPDDPIGKVVIVSKYTKILKMLHWGLRPSAGKSALLTGEISGTQRGTMIAAFNEPTGTDSPHVLLLQVKAGGVAITIDSADYMVMLDESDPDTMTQVEDRIHRVSNPRPVFYYYLRSIGTTDVGNAVVNAAVAKQSRRLLDKRRGVEYFREVMEASDVRGRRS